MIFLANKKFCSLMIFFCLASYFTKVKNVPYIYALIFQFVFIILILSMFISPANTFEMLKLS